MRRRRYQKGSLQARRHGNKRVWVVQYYDAEGHHRYHTLGTQSKLTKSQAAKKQDEFMQTVNGGKEEPGQLRPVLVREFIDQIYLPFYRGKWKRSTRGTSESRIRAHIVADLGNEQMVMFTPSHLQAYLDRKAVSKSFSTVDHLRWDLTSICDLAVAEKVLTSNPASELYTPTSARKAEGRVMSMSEVERALAAVEFRENVILHLAVFAGMRPGEILGLQRRHVAPDGSVVQVKQRVYRGDIDTPKNNRPRTVAIPPRTAARLREWMDAAVGSGQDAWIFASEIGTTPLWRDNLLNRHIRPALEKVGLGWVDFKVMRRTNASLGHSVAVDPKAAADQRGHGIGIALDVYTQTDVQQKAAAAKKLEDAVLGLKPITPGVDAFPGAVM